jgi:hypothetical protein
LERRTFPSGKDKVNHDRGSYDDLCNAAAGALVLASRRPQVEPPIVAAVVLDRYGQDISAAPPAVGRGINGPNYSMKDGWSPRW